MLEVLLCSLFTILPDYLFRKYHQGKTWGKEITFFTMWYELRWGISACTILAISLVTLIFYYHPSTTNATPMFRTVSIMPEKSGRVQHVFVENHQQVKAGTALFSMYDESQVAAIEGAQAQVQQVEAEFVTAYAQHAVTISVVERDKSAYLRSQHEYDRKKKLSLQGNNIISESEVQKLADTVAMQQATLSASLANQAAAQGVLDTILPAKRASAIETLESVIVDKAKRTIYARIDGELQQFALQPGDFVNPMIRAAGILVPTTGEASGKEAVQAGFNQLTANVIKVGTFAEITCMSKPFTIIPMKVASVQSVIATGQVRAVETLLDIQERARPGTLTVKLVPLYEGGLDGVIPGTKCIANAYSYHHELINSGTLSATESIYLHMVDTVGIVHAIILRMQALLLPVKGLVFSGN
ncbi:HlyD family secretion protein [Colwellia psychrerythraea]|uniref:Secretion protein HlyD family protein n=1 Tax=Colwellia psychrerythraea TaxID=28229 RepID=A0A099KFH7_COLPS|nr:biotin/lipoyl-binding protein [Colwellia psychrerythraea]KGJ89035.1 secretion protein HlyD family protein [Colwellia psychrerythraea]